MATYVVGDIQGCYRSFLALLEKITFSEQDRLWCVGDLVNRGSDSLGVLRWMLAHQHQVQTVLGNHDLHLLARAAGIRSAHRLDTLDALLSAPDVEALLTWLRQQPLVFAESGWVMSHAGLWPTWSVAEALAWSAEFSQNLQSEVGLSFLSHMFGNTPIVWQEELAGMDKMRMLVNICTRMRMLRRDSGVLDYHYKAGLAAAPLDLIPWFAVPSIRAADINVLCGHWYALGEHRAAGVWALDGGCVWGGELLALRLEDEQVFRQPSLERFA